MSRLATPIVGVDGESWLTVAGLEAHDAHFIGRYLSNDPAKNLSPDEAAYYKRNSIGYFTVWEDQANAAANGYDQGRSDAEQCLAMAKQCGYVEGKGHLHFAVDFDPVDPAETDGYFDGVASVIPKADCGPYGGIQVIQHQRARGFGALWQTLAWSEIEVQPCFADGDRFVSDYALVYQNNIVPFGYDPDVAYFADYGQWDYVEPPPVDPNHYDRYPATAYKIYGKKIDERAVAQQFDQVFAAHKKAPKDKKLGLELAALRVEVRMIRNRIMTVAHMNTDDGEFVMPPHWTRDWLGWRWQEWNHRLKESA